MFANTLKAKMIIVIFVNTMTILRTIQYTLFAKYHQQNVVNSHSKDDTILLQGYHQLITIYLFNILSYH